MEFNAAEQPLFRECTQLIKASLFLEIVFLLQILLVE